MKQPPQEVPFDVFDHACWAAPGSAPVVAWNVFSGTGEAGEPLYSYTMLRCQACGKRHRGPRPATQCRGVAPCCRPDRESVYTEYLFSHPSGIRFRKCAVCGRGSWHWGHLAAPPKPPADRS